MVAVACVAPVLAGCGSSGSSSSSTATNGTTAASNKQVVKLSITAPGDSSTVRTKATEVRGTINPQDATVMVLGKPAKVAGGFFSRTVDLSMGNNRIDVTATASGADPTTQTVTVTRGLSPKAQAAADARKRRARARRAAARARREREAEARRQAAANATSPLPNEVGERLDVAEDDLRGKGLRYREVGGGTFGIVVKSNWTVCETRPGPGTPVRKNTRVELIVDRAC